MKRTATKMEPVYAACCPLLFTLYFACVFVDVLVCPKKNDVMGTDKKKLLELHWLADLTKQFAP